jgi:hypothetical protein
MLFAALIASIAAGCGSDGDNPDSSNSSSSSSSGPNGSLPNQAITRLLSGAFFQLINTTSSVFGTLNSMTDPATGLGNAISPLTMSESVSTAQASGLVFNPTQPIACTVSGLLDLEVVLNIIRDSSSSSSSASSVSNGLFGLVSGDIEIAVDVDYADCHEPLNNRSNGVAGSPSQATDPDSGALLNNFLDGVFTISLRTTSSNNIFTLDGSIDVEDYFIEGYAEGTTPNRPDKLSGSVEVALASSDQLTYSVTMDTDIVNRNSMTDNLVQTSLSINGDIGISSTFGVNAYNLDIEGRIRDREATDNNNDYQVYTAQNLVRSAPIDNDTFLLGGVLGVPSEGVLALSTILNGVIETSTATVTETGLSIEAISNGITTTTNCTWSEVNNGSCGL